MSHRDVCKSLTNIYFSVTIKNLLPRDAFELTALSLTDTFFNRLSWLLIYVRMVWIMQHPQLLAQHLPSNVLPDSAFR